jgi:phosphoribosylformylglycinamidine synthase
MAVPSLGGSLWAASIHEHRGGHLPGLDLDLHARLLGLVAALVTDQLLGGVHDVSDGGIALALAEMAIRGAVGATIRGIGDRAHLFGEGPSRVVVSVSEETIGLVVERAEQAGVPVTVIGEAGGDRLIIDDLVDLSLADMVEAWRSALPRALGVEGAAAGAAAN